LCYIYSSSKFILGIAHPRDYVDPNDTEFITEISTLLIGESWQTIEFHIKGFDTFSNSIYHEAIDHLQDALENGGIETNYQPSHIAATAFPDSPESLAQYEVIVLTDIGYNTLALPPATFKKFDKQPNRLQLLSDYVRAGGGLLMIGGYLSYQGINGKGGYHGTPIEETLPVSLDQFDDRVERPAGVAPNVIEPKHTAVSEVANEWPDVLGYNRVVSDRDATELVRVDDDPLLAVGKHGDGRSAAFTSDCAPHWGPPEFIN
jgi:uncharacterized membrane protein